MNSNLDFFLLFTNLLRPTIMYRPTSNLPSHMRQSSLSTSNSQTSALQQRINEKRAELENLKQLRELSAGLAGQMEQLEEKLSTLSDGTQGVFLQNRLTNYQC